MPETPYIIAVLAIVFTVTLALRALPFAALRALRESVMVRKLWQLPRARISSVWER